MFILFELISKLSEIWNEYDFEMGVASMKFDLILSKSLTWKVSAFFRSIGQKKVVKNNYGLE